MEFVRGETCPDTVRELIAEYTKWLGRDLEFQHLEHELEDPGFKYFPPNGETIVAVEDGRALGMVAYNRHNAKRCEFKRLYVRPEVRGRHLGHELMVRIIDLAVAAGYEEMVLDTILPLQQAIGMYRRYGFVEIPPYYRNPMKDVIYMSLDLTRLRA